MAAVVTGIINSVVGFIPPLWVYMPYIIVLIEFLSLVASFRAVRHFYIWRGSKETTQVGIAPRSRTSSFGSSRKKKVYPTPADMQTVCEETICTDERVVTSALAFTVDVGTMPPSSLQRSRVRSEHDSSAVHSFPGVIGAVNTSTASKTEDNHQLDFDDYMETPETGSFVKYRASGGNSAGWRQ